MKWKLYFHLDHWCTWTLDHRTTVQFFFSLAQLSQILERILLENPLKDAVIPDLVHLFLLLDHLFAEYWTICTLLDATMPFQRHRPFCNQDSPLLQIPSATAADMTGRPKSDVTGDYKAR
ncbi:hypothetical protein XENOCAPTIV_022433 [Xenoophorus captivus]|uniref:Uncharacterized protein n=1 Tax=Xenoophorus captivus TaxID=1517983 RepID=A0ABV0R2T0_9TELE